MAGFTTEGPITMWKRNGTRTPSMKLPTFPGGAPRT